MKNQIYFLVRSASLVMAVFLFLFLNGCLLFYPEPEIELIEDQTIPANEELTVELKADSKGKTVSFTYEITKLATGWEKIEGNTFSYTFEEAGEYEVTITASNGLREASTSFMVSVN